MKIGHRATWFSPDRPVSGTVNFRAGEHISHEPALVAQAWHDITCPEGPECRDRLPHSAAQPVANSGHLARFLQRLAELEAP